MTQLLDTEGAHIPSDDDEGRPLFDADLCDWNDGKGPALTINIPMYFETIEGTYNSGGVISAPLQEILEQYMRDFKEIDGGDGIDIFCTWLHDYANRLKSANTEQISSQKPC